MYFCPSLFSSVFLWKRSKQDRSNRFRIRTNTLNKHAWRWKVTLFFCSETCKHNYYYNKSFPLLDENPVCTKQV